MMKKLLNFSAIALLSSISFSVLAQDNNGSAPIFIQKYKQPTITSQIPTIVQTQTNTRTTTSQRNSRQSGSYALVDSPNPWSQTSFGRIKDEVDYYDKETGQYYNQYNYMGLLAKRGDEQKLGQVANYLQLNGVFDPQQYQSAVTNAVKGGAVLSNVDMAVAARKTTMPNIEAETGEQATTAQAKSAQPKTVVKQLDDFTPKRIHQGYDDDMRDDAVTKPKSNQPIFLR